MTPSPRELGYRMPGEWEPHSATWLSWPHKMESWPGKFDSIPGIFADIVRILAAGERVQINVCDGAMETEARELLVRSRAMSENVCFHRIPTNDAWCRDHGPIFLVRQWEGGGELAAVDWKYNAWGGKYPPYDLDDQVPARIAGLLGIPCFAPDIVLEGGSIDVNGAGTLLTTEACLLNPNRNPHLTKAEIESHLRDYLGVGQIVWLGQGIQGDDTDGHVDDLARFVDPKTVITVLEEDTADENYRPLQDNLRRLQSARDPSGRPFEIVVLPMPPAVYCQGQRLPCSYANFYIGNEVVLVPAFGAADDAVAVEILQRLFRFRRVVGMDARDLVWGLGAFHCVTQQQPAVQATGERS